MRNNIHEIAKRVWGEKVNEDEINIFLQQLKISEPLTLKVTEQALLDNYMESFITSFDDLIFELDSEGRIINIWAADESLLWGEKDEILYKNLREYIPQPLGDTLYEAFLKAQELKMPVEVEYQSPFDGSYFVARLNIIKSSRPDKKHVSALVKNITERKKNEQALLEAMKTAKEALSAKSQFLSSISHEIRTPMNAIAGLTDILLSQQHNKETMEYLRSIKHSSDNLLIIVNDILHFNKIEVGKVLFEKIDFNLHDQVSELQKTLGLRTADKNISFETELMEDVPKMLVGDPYRLNQILINLIGNAIKFTQEGIVCLKVLVEKQEGHHIDLVFEIKDTGIGIPQDKLEKIFESFTQASSDTTRRFGGTGLGLSITRSLILQQGGSIRVKSIEGHGSTFIVSLPFTISSNKEISSNEMVFDKKPLAKIKVLVAEDNAINQVIVKKMLDDWQVTYYLANNGVEVIDIMKENEVDLVLMDLHMPEMDGFQATGEIRNSTSGVLNPDVPIIAFTADAFPETKIKVLESGMNDFISKPFKKEDLYSKMIKQLVIL